jgi:RNase H-fold protein (predicted Holliday junction resolvase)
MIGAGVRKKSRRRKGTADLWAASIILQEYLDSTGGRR